MGIRVWRITLGEELAVAAAHRRGDLRGGEEGWDRNERFAAMTGIFVVWSERRVKRNLKVEEENVILQWRKGEEKRSISFLSREKAYTSAPNCEHLLSTFSRVTLLCLF